VVDLGEDGVEAAQAAEPRLYGDVDHWERRVTQQSLGALNPRGSCNGRGGGAEMADEQAPEMPPGHAEAGGQRLDGCAVAI
jgi:hypothetical protein